MFLMKNIPLDMRQLFMAHSYEVAKYPFNARCNINQASVVRCVDTSIPRWDILIWLADTNLHTWVSRTLYVAIIEFCGNFFVLYIPLFLFQVVEWICCRK